MEARGETKPSSSWVPLRHVQTIIRRSRRTLPLDDPTMLPETDLDRDFEGIEKIAWRQWLILANNPFRIAWDWGLIAVVIYTAIVVPMEISFPYTAHVGVQVIDVFVDVYFILDLVLNFQTCGVRRLNT